MSLASSEPVSASDDAGVAPIAIPSRRTTSNAQTNVTANDNESPCSSYSDASCVSENSTWTPAGVYIPVHRRRGSNSSSSALGSASSPPRSAKFALPASYHSTQYQNTNSDSPPKPHAGVYTRDELLALAPSSLVITSLRPIVTPTLITAHPRILRARGDGVARALAMSRSSSIDGNANFALNNTMVHSPMSVQTRVAGAQGGHAHPLAQTSPRYYYPSKNTVASNAQQPNRRRDRRRPNLNRGSSSGNSTSSNVISNNVAPADAVAAPSISSVVGAPDSDAQNAGANEETTADANSAWPKRTRNRARLPHRHRNLENITGVSSWRAPQAAVAA
ncbi:uncharacterized protein FOMMEDRAFT_171195 [Fomitiporia mediterranea MF3/22]|uniref:uncharacterized protein n=1 Tax=Fomitiporia mediterranea (strain MF3/22) TaxID=694068 RepID=UPI000440779E|nr:uncharacterized protein FOMMEDRAFT_171195 [Fomitiporia mediterranea MF3/22]EJC98271.1 hypothetical protein FOMMEDRAFT_171195 [Fomitiporia mediterranea MF3/22]